MFEHNPMRTVFGLWAVALLTVFGSQALAICSPTDQAAADQRYNTAYQLISAQQWAEAIPELEAAMELCPENWQALELLAQSRLQAQQNAQSARDYQRLIDGQHGGTLENADPERILKPYGFALLRSKNWDQAIMVYNAMLTVDPHSEEAHERLVYIYTNTNDFAHAAVYLEQLYNIVDDETKRGDIATRLGNAYTKLGQPEKAKTWLKAGSGGGGGMFQIGVDHMKNKEYTQAVSAFRDYLETNPGSMAAWKNLGQCYERMGREPGGTKYKRDAISAYEKVIAAEPQRHDVLSSLGFLYLDVEEFGKAASIAENALSSWPDSDEKKGGMYYLMGKVLEKRDANYEQAIQMFELALGDSYWGTHAREEIDRQAKLIEIREMRKKQGGR